MSDSYGHISSAGVCSQLSNAEHRGTNLLSVLKQGDIYGKRERSENTKNIIKLIDPHTEATLLLFCRICRQWPGDGKNRPHLI